MHSGFLHHHDGIALIAVVWSLRLALGARLSEHHSQYCYSGAGCFQSVNVVTKQTGEIGSQRYCL